MDELEEQITLSLQEHNFSNILKNIAKLLEAKIMYLRNRVNIRRAKFGNESQKISCYCSPKLHA